MASNYQLLLYGYLGLLYANVKLDILRKQVLRLAENGYLFSDFTILMRRFLIQRFLGFGRLALPLTKK